MPKTARLTHAQMLAFSRVRAKRLHGTYFSLSYGPLEGLSRAHCSCVVSKKVAARANVRNRIKRHCRESLRAAAKAIAPGAYVLSAKRGAARASAALLREDVAQLLERAK